MAFCMQAYNFFYYYQNFGTEALLHNGIHDVDDRDIGMRSLQVLASPHWFEIYPTGPRLFHIPPIVLLRCTLVHVKFNSYFLYAGYFTHR